MTKRRLSSIAKRACERQLMILPLHWRSFVITFFWLLLLFFVTSFCFDHLIFSQLRSLLFSLSPSHKFLLLFLLVPHDKHDPFVSNDPRGVHQPRRDVHRIPGRELDVGERRGGNLGLGISRSGPAPRLRPDDKFAPSLGDAHALVPLLAVGVVLEGVARREVEGLRAREAFFFFFFFSSLSQRSVVPTATSTARARPLFLSLSHSLSSRRPAHPARAKAAHIASELITSPSLAGSQEIFGPKCRGGEGLAEAEEAEAASRPRPALAGAWRADCGGEPPPTLLRKPPASERAAHRGASTKRRARESIVARRAFFGEICCWRNL